MPRKVEVTIDARDVIAAHHDILIGILVLRKLREADIPVKGAVGVVGLESGSLTFSEDAFGNHLYVWEE
jgi:hypothetical protein